MSRPIQESELHPNEHSWKGQVRSAVPVGSTSSGNELVRATEDDTCGIQQYPTETHGKAEGDDGKSTKRNVNIVDSGQCQWALCQMSRQGLVPCVLLYSYMLCVV